MSQQPEFTRESIRGLVVLAVLLWAVVGAICFWLWVSPAGAECFQFYENGRATSVCSSVYDHPRPMSPGPQDYQDQTDHNRGEWKRLLRIQPGSEDFNERVMEYLEGDDED
jgi:hypothetical protein